MSRRAAGGHVVVTGVGVVSACGAGLAPLAADLAAGTARAHPVERLAGVPPRAGSARTAALVTARDFQPWLDRRTARRMSPPSIYAVVAARMALGSAGLPFTIPPRPDPATGVLLATAFGAVSYSQRMLDQILDEGPESISPFLFMESVANAPAGQVAIQCGAGGPNHTLCQREAGPAAALGRGAAEIAAGRAERVLTGACEEMTPLLHTLLDRFGALSDHPRPFDLHRDGVLAAEGATVLLLEEEEAARRRGAVVGARLTAWGGAFDPTAPRHDWGEGADGLAAAMRRGLERYGLAPGDVDAVLSGASGARRGDRLEAAVLRRLFDGAPPPVLTPKGTTGEYGGAWLAAALPLLEGRPVAAAGFSTPDPELGIVPVERPPRPPSRLLVTAFAAGGAMAWVMLEAANP